MCMVYIFISSCVKFQYFISSCVKFQYFTSLRHQFESGKTQKSAGRRLSVAIGNTKVTIAIGTIIQV
jgi:hypothetical protein